MGWSVMPAGSTAELILLSCVVWVGGCVGVWVCGCVGVWKWWHWTRSARYSIDINMQREQTVWRRGAARQWW
jgi:hypothetical protein